MVSNKTWGKGTTHSRTRIHTVLINAGLISGTLCINNTLWLALHIRISSVVSNAFTRCSSTIFWTLCINSTRWGIARLDDFNWPRSCSWSVTACKWISNKTRNAYTYGNVVVDSAVCITATQSRAWVYAFLLLTGFVWWTILVENALWPTVGRGPCHPRQTGTVTMISISSWWVWVQPTRIRITWILFNNWCYSWIYILNKMCLVAQI